MRFIIAALLFLLAAGPAWAHLTRAQLDSVSASPPAGARLDPQLTAYDASGTKRSIGSVLAGRTGFVSFVDYTCNTLCGTDLALLSQAIQNSRIPLSQYRIVIIGIDPRDSAQAARAMERKEIPAALWPATVLLRPDLHTLQKATSALGFHSVYDSTIDQFAHPAVIYVVASDGELRAMLSPLTLTPQSLRDALDAAPASGFFARVVHLCYAYDPATGVYTLRVEMILRIAAIATVLLLGSAVLLLFRNRRSAT